MKIVEEYWQGVADRLQIEAENFNRLLEHHGEVGGQNELSIASVIERLLPPTVGVGTGFIFDHQGNRSHQTDVILFDKASQPQFLAQTVQMLYPVEIVLFAIEVKTTVDKAAVIDTSNKRAALRSVGEDIVDVPMALFGYQCGGAAQSVINEINSLEQGSKPDLVCVINPGIFGDLNEGNLGYVPLHARDEQNERIPGEWIRHDANAVGQFVQVGSARYPTARTELRARTKIVGEPGRALLLFCASLLRELTKAGRIDAAWLDRYLSGAAHELLEAEAASDSV